MFCIEEKGWEFHARQVSLYTISYEKSPEITNKWINISWYMRFLLSLFISLSAWIESIMFTDCCYLRILV